MQSSSLPLLHKQGLMMKHQICSDDYCAETRRLVWFCSCFFFFTWCSELLFMASVGSEQNKPSRLQVNHCISQLIHDSQSTVIVQWYLKQRHDLTNLPFVYIIVRLQTLYFQLLCFVMLFVSLLMTCMLVWMPLLWLRVNQAISSGLMILRVINPVTETNTC